MPNKTKKVSLPRTHSHHTFRHAAATLHNSTNLFPALQPTASQAWPTLPCHHMLQDFQLCLPIRCTSLSSPLWSNVFPLLFLCIPFSTGIASPYAMPWAQPSYLSFLYSRKKSPDTQQLSVSLPPASAPPSSCHLPDLDLLYRSRSPTVASFSLHLSRARNVF